MKEKLAKLFEVKSLITIALTVLFCTLAYKTVITGEQVNTIFTTVIAFYFGTQYEKKKTEV